MLYDVEITTERRHAVKVHADNATQAIAAAAPLHAPENCTGTRTTYVHAAPCLWPGAVATPEPDALDSPEALTRDLEAAEREARSYRKKIAALIAENRTRAQAVDNALAALDIVKKQAADKGARLVEMSREVESTRLSAEGIARNANRQMRQIVLLREALIEVAAIVEDPNADDHFSPLKIETIVQTALDATVN